MLTTLTLTSDAHLGTAKTTLTLTTDAHLGTEGNDSYTYERCTLRDNGKRLLHLRAMHT